MFDHVNYDVSDLGRSVLFFERALGPLGHRKLRDLTEYGVVGFGSDRARFWVVAGLPKADSGELHVCFSARTRAEVDAFYAAAIAAGGRDNGKPGIREEYGPDYYAAFVLDPDGRNIEAVCRSTATG